MFVERLSCDNPEMTGDEISESLRMWWRSRPGAPDGDAIESPRPVDSFA